MIEVEALDLRVVLISVYCLVFTKSSQVNVAVDSSEFLLEGLVADGN